VEPHKQWKLDELIGAAASVLGTALEKKASDIVEDVKKKISKRLREDTPELENASQSQTLDNDPEEATYNIPSYLPTARFEQSIRSTYRPLRRQTRRRNKVFFATSRYRRQC